MERSSKYFRWREQLSECLNPRSLREFGYLDLAVQYLGVLKVNLWDYKGNVLTQKG